MTKNLPKRQVKITKTYTQRCYVFDFDLDFDLYVIHAEGLVHEDTIPLAGAIGSLVRP